MGHYDGIDLLVSNRSLIPASIKAASIDFPGNLLGLHTMAGSGKQTYYGFFEFHLIANLRKVWYICVYLRNADWQNLDVVTSDQDIFD